MTGLEPSAAMIELGLHDNPGLVAADLVLGRAEDLDRFPPDCFDCIVSRQVLCHLNEEEAHFRSLQRWLKPGGHVVVVDGFWDRSVWTETEVARFI